MPNEEIHKTTEMDFSEIVDRAEAAGGGLKCKPATQSSAQKRKAPADTTEASSELAEILKMNKKAKVTAHPKAETASKTEGTSKLELTSKPLSKPLIESSSTELSSTMAERGDDPPSASSREDQERKMKKLASTERKGKKAGVTSSSTEAADSTGTTLETTVSDVQRAVFPSSFDDQYLNGPEQLLNGLEKKLAPILSHYTSSTTPRPAPTQQYPVVISSAISSRAPKSTPLSNSGQEASAEKAKMAQDIQNRVTGLKELHKLLLNGDTVSPVLRKCDQLSDC